MENQAERMGSGKSQTDRTDRIFAPVYSCENIKIIKEHSSFEQ